LAQGLGFYKYSYTITSKLITCFTVGFTSKMKSQSIAYLLNDNKHIYWILNLENKMHSI